MLLCGKYLDTNAWSKLNITNSYIHEYIHAVWAQKLSGLWTFCFKSSLIIPVPMPKHPTNGLDYAQQWWISKEANGTDMLMIASFQDEDPYLVILHAFSETTKTYMEGGRVKFIGNVDGFFCFDGQPIMGSIFELSDAIDKLEHREWLELFAIHGFPVIVHWRSIGESTFLAAPWHTGSYEAFRDMEPLDMTTWLNDATVMTTIAKPHVPMILFPRSIIKRAEYVWWLMHMMQQRSTASSTCSCSEMRQFWQIWQWDYNYPDPIHAVLNLWKVGLAANADEGELHFVTEGWQEDFWLRELHADSLEL